MSSPHPLAFPLLLLLIQTLVSIALATVPVSQTFKYVNEGELGPYIVEYGASYRTLNTFKSPFQFCFYNTTPNAFTFAIRMGTVRSTSLMRWVWEANRGKPVREKATLTFGSNGNLVLADVGGGVVWQTGTANKGVVGLKILPNGNLVLLDSKGKFVWQSFDFPTDTILVGQSLRVGGATKLVSRASERDNVNGAYSLVLEPTSLNLYYKSNNSPKPMLYFSSSSVWFSISKGTLQNVTLFSAPETDENFAFDLGLEYQVANSDISQGNRFLARPKYNSTYTYLRLGIDGSLKLHTFYDKVDIGAWEVTYSLFDRDGDISECQLPERCGNFGLCEDNQCVACPSSSEPTGWSSGCEPVKVSSCKPNDFTYYKIEGVDHFLSKYTEGDGPVSDDECRNKCNKDCKCMGYFFHLVVNRCWVVNDLKTLTRIGDSRHLAYIKTPTH